MINWKIRFSANNRLFLGRFFLAIFLPVLTYFGMEPQDLTTWEAVAEVLLKTLSNPFVLGLMVCNALNVIPDPTTKGLPDSRRALGYEQPQEDLS